MVWSVCFNITAQCVISYTIGFVLRPQSVIKKMPYRLACLQPDLAEVISQWGFPSLRGLSLVSSWQKPSIATTTRAPWSLIVQVATPLTVFPQCSLQVSTSAPLPVDYGRNRKRKGSVGSPVPGVCPILCDSPRTEAMGWCCVPVHFPVVTGYFLQQQLLSAYVIVKAQMKPHLLPEFFSACPIWMWQGSSLTSCSICANILI